jgi:HlyD family secretion protein
MRTDMNIHRTVNWSIAAAVIALLAWGCGGRKESNPSGTLEATEVDVVSTVPGRIISIAADLGDKVNKNDTLVVLDTELLRLQKKQAETNRESLHAQREVLRDQRHQAETSFDLARTSFERTAALLRQGSATQQQFDEMKAKQDLAESQVSSIKDQLDALDAEEAKLNATLAVFDRQLQDAIIQAPIGGTVLLRPSEPGEMASPGAVLLRLADLSTLDLRVFLSETDIGRVKIGEELPVVVDAFHGESFTGTVAWISSESEFTPKNAQTREARTQLVYAIKVRIKNPDGRLHIGMPAEAKLTSP